MLERPAEVADKAREAVFPRPHADPDRVLLEERLVEPVLLAQELGFLHRCLVALALQLGDLVGRKSPGGSWMITKVTKLITISVGIMINIRRSV